MRLDKYLSNAGLGSRNDVKRFIRKKHVAVNGKVVTDPKSSVSAEDTVEIDGEAIQLEQYIYFMLNKPSGVISSTEEGATSTVIDLIDHPQKDELFPVGRLDKDTTGLLLISNDGKLAHTLLSPRKKQPKTYIATLAKAPEEKDLELLREGVPLKDFTSAPAQAHRLSEKVVELTITEGKFHQVKRMFGYLENEVIALERISFAGLELDGTLEPGEYRRLKENEIALLRNV
ncbi:pseudouridine synthase [Salinicoccus siamensis]|uniref:Pseudouridine synthase n=1 Tax=Salinicoccus siamensis TaxID=381830 RepID=A0ABV5Z0X6_9STAP